MANPFDDLMQPAPLPDFSALLAQHRGHGGGGMPQPMAAPLPDFSGFGGMPQPAPLPTMPAAGGGGGGQNPLQQLMMLLPLLVAAKQGGGAGVGGFARGYLSSRSYLDEQQRMAEAMRVRQEQEQYDRARQEQADQERRQKIVGDILLGAGQPLLERTMSTLDQTPGLDPEAAANQQAEAYANVLRRLYPNLALTGADLRAVMPDVQTQYSARLKRHANEVLSQYEGKYSEKDLQALGPKIPFANRAVTIDELRGIAQRATGLTPIKEQDKPDTHSAIYKEWQDYKAEGGTMSFDAYMTADANRKRASVNVTLSPNAEAGIIDKLAKQWTTATAAPSEMRRQFNLMKTGLARYDRDPNGASQAILVTFQKILDPTSVVRESEYARSAAGVSMLERMRGYAEKLARGGAGVPKSALAEMVNTANEFLKNSEATLPGVRRRLELTADRYHIPRELIFSDAPPSAPDVNDSSPLGRLKRRKAGG